MKYLFVFVVLLTVSCSGDLAPPPFPIRNVSFAGEDIAWIVTSTNELLKVSNTGQVEEVGQFEGTARVVHFLDELQGWILDSDGRIWATTNATDWGIAGEIHVDTSRHAHSMVFADSQTGWLITSMAVLVTVNGGVSWDRVTPSRDSVSGSNPSDFHPINSEGGWLLMSNATLARTYDRGSTWNIIELIGRFDVGAMFCHDSGECWVGAENDGGLFRIDPDSSEIEKKEEVSNAYGLGIYSISFSDSQNGWLAGMEYARLTPSKSAKGILMNTQDGGNTWNDMPVPELDSRYMKVRFFDHKGGWLASDRAVYFTRDAGSTWEKVLERNN